MVLEGTKEMTLVALGFELLREYLSRIAIGVHPFVIQLFESWMVWMAAVASPSDFGIVPVRILVCARPDLEGN